MTAPERSHVDPPVLPTDVVEVVVHGAMFPGVLAYLEREDFRLQELPQDDPDALRCFVVVLGPGRGALLKAMSDQTVEDLLPKATTDVHDSRKGL